jgi:hypothetical protein
MANIPADDERAIAVTRAIHQGDVEGLRALLEENPALARSRIVDGMGVGRTPLHLVADWPGHFPNGAGAVAVLVAAGAEVNGAVQHGRHPGSPETALHWAASCDDVAVLDALLDAGADIEAPGAVFTGGPAMSDAVVFAQWRAARRLLERGAVTTFWQAAALGLAQRVREEASTQPPPSREVLTNALWHACRGGQLEVAKALLERGADPHWLGYDGKTPLDVARESGVTGLVEELKGHGARSAKRT